MIQAGDRLYIAQDIQVTGVQVGTNATVIDFFPNEIYGIQVELDIPDADGHKMKRVSYQDIKIIPPVDQRPILTVLEPIQPTGEDIDIPL